jgi:hypothetical protein
MFYIFGPLFSHSVTPDLLLFAYKYTEADIKGMLGFLVDNIYLVFGDQVFQQSVGIPMGTNCAPLLADLFLCMSPVDSIHKNMFCVRGLFKTR